ncbi:putative LPS assembly protein LptD [Candidatus Cardinium sp. TP]|uniref:putative LPS assembly protein LptD n=1 Tax=Candidatus Cardinium sp. TP TaxID=2961955 RepID=UPI0021AE476E|nr:putative LPS assembly protein LptD [Candidatus Cardinium sp. TP]MCT4697319.1 putative LPS assembly protein LptD [Candidatus Cardinium sp. TP]
MPKSYFLRIVAVVPFIFSGVSAKATAYFNCSPYFSNGYNTAYRSWIQASSYSHTVQPYTADRKSNRPLTFHKSYRLILLLSSSKQSGEHVSDMVHYQATDSIVFDAKKDMLSLHGASRLAYDKIKLEADIVALHLKTHTLYAKGSKDLHNQPIGNPIFTYQDVTKNKYGKAGSTQTRIFFMETIRYNIETKRALVDRLLTKQEASIVKSKQIKKEDEVTFYGEDIIYTTCPLAHPHFYIRTKRAKIVRDQQITSGPFRLYFDQVPTPLGSIFGTLFLEGKRTYGIIPPEIGEGEYGFYLRNGGYYINFNDYVDISILGSLYSSGTAELKNTLRYKRRYQYSGNLHYTVNRTEKEKGWSLKCEHTTLKHGPTSLNAKLDLHNKSYKTFDHEDNKNPKSMEQQCAGSLSYQNNLIGFPYGLTVRAAFELNQLSNFIHWTLPNGSLYSTAWHPFKSIRSTGTHHWFHTMEIKHTIDFETHLQNAKKDPNPLNVTNNTQAIFPTYRWNHYTERGVKHTIPLSIQCKLFEFINLEPHFTYNAGWYWLKKKTKGPIRKPGFNQVYTWHLGATLGTTLYHTHYFEGATSIQGFRIKMEPSINFTYTPDFSKKYCQEVENAEGKKERKYVFTGLRPGLDVPNHATSILNCKLHNTVELKIKKSADPEKKEKKRSSHKIFLLKNLDFETKYDFQAKKDECHLVDGIHMHMASEAKIGKMGKIDFDLKANFDPYLTKKTILDDDSIKEEPINHFAWHYGQDLWKVKNASCKISIDLAHHARKEKKKALLQEHDQSVNNMENHKIDFEVPWNIGSEFNVVYNRLYAYKEGAKNYSIEKYISFNGSITLVKKWKINLRTTYNFNKNEFDASATEISIERDLHCWQLSYQWHPLGNSAKYDFSLGVKANVLKVLKLPRKRSYNKLHE